MSYLYSLLRIDLYSVEPDTVDVASVNSCKWDYSIRSGRNLYVLGEIVAYTV